MNGLHFNFSKIFCSVLLLLIPFIGNGIENIGLVSVLPYKTFVREIAGDTVTINVVVPTGASSHTFEPTYKQMLAMSRANIWFRIGEGFEKRLLQVVKAYNPQINIVDLRKNVEMICSEHHHHHNGHPCSEDFYDVHIWLSPREVKKQAQDIATALIQQYPSHASLYEQNLKKFIHKLDSLDKELASTLSSHKGTSFLVSHPAYAYFSRDYGLKQLSVEFEGRDPTPQQLTNLLKQAKELRLSTLFIQPQHSSKGAKLIAAQIGAEIINLDPYAEDYFANMRTLATSLSSGQCNRGKR